MAYTFSHCYSILCYDNIFFSIFYVPFDIERLPKVFYTHLKSYRVVFFIATIVINHILPSSMFFLSRSFVCVCVEPWIVCELFFFRHSSSVSLFLKWCSHVFAQFVDQKSHQTSQKWFKHLIFVMLLWFKCLAK